MAKITMAMHEGDLLELLMAIERNAVVVRLGGEVWRLPITAETIARNHLEALARVLNAARTIDHPPF